MPTQHKVLIFDVETAPNLAFMWRPKTRWINKEMLVESWFMLSWAAKWQGEGSPIRSEILSPNEVIAQDDAELADGLARMIDYADAVVAHNAKSFDLKILNSRLLKHGLDPLAPVKVIDTLKIARASFKLTYNNLDYLAEFLGLETKHDTDFELWRQCYYGEQDALDTMLEYNEQDVRVLEQVYRRLKPYAKGLPRLVEADHDNQRVCPMCGAEDSLIKRGFYHTAASTFQRWRCSECKRWSRSRSSEKNRRPDTVRLR